METGYLIDTNVVIDFLDNKLPEAGSLWIETVAPQISVITRMELLGWPNANNSQLQVLQKFINASVEFGLDEPTILKAIELRRICTIKLPDAIIAATAIINDLILLTRNISDFHEIQGLQVMNPHQS